MSEFVPDSDCTGPKPCRAPAREALDRTMRLMRDDLTPNVTDDALLAALLHSRVRLVADAATLVSPAAQTALVTTALLLLRTGTTVIIDAPNVELLAPQPPIQGNRLIDGLLEVGSDLIEGVTCLAASDVIAASSADDVVVCFGDSAWKAVAGMLIRVVAGGVHGRMLVTIPTEDSRTSWSGMSWDPALRVPLGAFVVAGLVAGEVYKRVMRSLAEWALSPANFNEFFAISQNASVSLDPANEVSVTALDGLRDVGMIDAISGGAIIQSFLYVLCRLPSAHAIVRVIEPEIGEASNLNRYALLRRSTLGEPKARSLSEMSLGNIHVIPKVARYDRYTPAILGGLSEAVVVGVDHIPTRWAAQEAQPRWLGIGATSHYSAMSSEHSSETPCAWCLHPADTEDFGPIPTVAFVSHWVGLLLAWRFIRHRLNLRLALTMQYDYLSPLRADQNSALWRSPIAPRDDCPNGCDERRRVA